MKQEEARRQKVESGMDCQGLGALEAGGRHSERDAHSDAGLSPEVSQDRPGRRHHPNLTIWKNKVDVRLFVGVHCRQSNIALTIIRGGTDCFTIALCTFSGDDETPVTIRDLTAETIQRIVDAVHRQKRSRFV